MAQIPETVVIDCFKCNNCGNITLARKKVCPKCGSAAIQMVKSEGKGEVVDFAPVYFPPQNYKEIAPYTSLKVRLHNGCMVFGVMEGADKDILPGTLVTLVKRDEATGGLFFRFD